MNIEPTPPPDWIPPGALLCDESIRELIAPRMHKPGEPATTFAEGTSGPGVISYGVTSAGYDFRMGPKARAFTNVHSPVIDPLAFDPSALVDLAPRRRSARWPVEPGSSTHVVRHYEYVIIPPNGHILAETVEWIDVPRGVLVVLLGKSTYARCGIIVNCTPLEPGWRGRVTLEIANLSNVPAVVYLGMGIAQGLFLSLDRLPRRAYSDRRGKYQDQLGLEPPRAV